MQRKINPIELGATLFAPATHKNILPILKKEKYPQLKSLLIDFEDGLGEASYRQGVETLQKLLLEYEPNELLVFVRPKDPESLQELLELEGIEKVDGFILPKFSLKNCESYKKTLLNSSFYVMPSIEGKELFSETLLEQLKAEILEFKEQLLLVRIGCEDMLRQLVMTRSCEKSLFDYAVPSFILGRVMALFKSEGVFVSGCVYPCFQDTKGFMRDIHRDLEEGLFSKTIIHPSHITPANEAYKVTTEELAKAKDILKTSQAILNQKGTMGEKKTRTPHAKFILKRAEVYGTIYFQK